MVKNAILDKSLVNQEELLNHKPIDKKALKAKVLKVYSSLEPDYNEYRKVWEVLAEYSGSFRGRFKNEDRLKFLSRSDKIIDNTMNKSLNILSSGLQSGLTNQTTRWFKYGIEDTDLMDFHPVKEWLRACEDINYSILTKSNFYKLTPSVYKELGLFGQPCLIQSQSVKTISQFNDFTCGEFMIGANGNGEVCYFGRYFLMSVYQIVSNFGLDNVTSVIREAYNSSNYGAMHNVIHVIMPNDMMDSKKLDSLSKPFISVYYLESSNDDELLSVSGYDDFPVHTPRWETMSNEVYAISPAMNALGVTKALQKWHEIRHFGAHMQARPALNVPKSMYEDGYKPSLVPGGINPYEDKFGNNGVTSTISGNLDINAVREIINESKFDISEAMFADVFKMIANTTKSMTATEVLERQEEKMLLLGPVLNNVITEFLSPVLKQTFNQSYKLGALPPPPPELEGKEIKIEYLSVLAQAQRIVENRANQEFVGFVGSMAQLNPNALKKLNVNRAIDDFADKRGVNPKIVVSNEEVEELIESENQQMAQERMMEQAKQALGGVETLSNIQRNGGMM